MAGWLALGQFLAVALVLALVHRPLGDYLAHAYTSGKDLAPERGVYRMLGVAPRSGQTWQSYLRSVLVFSALGVLALYLLQRMQPLLPASLGLPAVPEGLAFNTAVSVLAYSFMTPGPPGLFGRTSMRHLHIDARTSPAPSRSARCSRSACGRDAPRHPGWPC